MSTGHIQLTQVSRAYPEGNRLVQVLKDVSITQARGETIALTGPSGSGKSTLLNLLAGIDAPDSGDITIAGESIVSGSETDRTLYRRRHIGLVFQAFNLLPTLTLSENIALPLQLNAVARDQINKRVMVVLDRVGLADRAGAFPHQCSGGEQQRVAIARALIHQPQLILADEPTGNLDAQNAQRIMSLLLELVRDEQGSLLIATHSRSVAQQVDKVWAIEHRTINDVSHHQQLDHLT